MTKEQESTRELELTIGIKFWKVTAILVAFGFIVISIAAISETSILKNQLEDCQNGTQVQADYHSSGKLFCEHYDGTYKETGFLYYDYCYWLINDVKVRCDITKTNGRYSFLNDCEVYPNKKGGLN